MSLLESAVFFRDLAREPDLIARGSGVYLYDRDGNRYLDAASGAAVASLGHGNEEIAETLYRQAATLSYAHPSKFASTPMVELAERLREHAPQGLGRVYFTSGGSEATEAAMKLARQYHLAAGNPARYKTLSRRISYHGATLGALSVSGQQSRRQPFRPMLMAEPSVSPAYRYRCALCQSCNACSLACADDLERAIVEQGPEEVAAFIAEPIVGSSIPGSYPPDEYWHRIREICDRHGVLFIADEVMSGNGRSGKWWAVQHTAVVPDIIATAKGIGAGYAPLGALLVAEHVYDAVRRKGSFRHGHTYAGNPVSCAVGCKVLDIIERDRLLDNVTRMGEKLLRRLRETLEEHPNIGEIRGRGLLLGIEFVADRTTRAPLPRERDI